jgi:hypothetical protein
VRKCLMLLCLCWSMGVLAQEDFQLQLWEVYLMRGVTNNGADRITFIDILTGETRTTEVSGERYTILDNSIIYFDYNNQRVMSVGIDGIPRTHPFIQMNDNARRVDWVVSSDGRLVAWTQTFGEPNALYTQTNLATPSGANRVEVLNDGVRDGIRAMPVAFNADATHLYMDAQPDGIGQFSAYTQFAGLFSVNIATSDIEILPNEPSCFCGAGFMGDTFLRLGLSASGRGFDVHVYGLRDNTDLLIPSVELSDYTQAGDVLISADETLAVYALSRVENFGTPTQSVRTVFVLVDILAGTQTPLTDPITTYVHPVHWTEQNTAIVFTSPQLNGTWKISLSDRELKRVAEETYLGMMRS